MLPFHRILFTVDFSDGCKAIVPYVKDLRSRYEAELTLLHAFEPYPIVSGGLGMPVLAAYPPPVDLRRAEMEALEKFALDNFPESPPFVRIEDGEPGAVIRDFVRHNGTDLVMMPTSGRGPVRRFLLGSVTAKVLHDVDCALWTGVPGHIEEHHAHIPYRSILCAVDLGEEAASILKAAGLLAQAYGAELSVVHAVEAPPAAFEIDMEPYGKALIGAADAAMQKLKEQVGVEANSFVLKGSLSEAVKMLSVERQVDLIVTGRGHSQTGMGRWWSQLYMLTREAPCPVLSI